MSKDRDDELNSSPEFSLEEILAEFGGGGGGSSSSGASSPSDGASSAGGSWARMPGKGTTF